MSPTFLGFNIEDWFTYHPPITQERKDKHALANSIALSMAKRKEDDSKSELDYLDELLTLVNIPEIEQKIRNQFLVESSSELDRMFNIQFARMLTNQAITLHSLKEVL